MKKLIVLLLLVFIVFVIYERNRLYLRDPLATVTRDGAKEDGAQVFINYNNDALLENDNPPAYVTAVQHDNHIGTPASLKCLHWVVCLADADAVTLIQPLAGATVETMSNKLITYRAGTQETAITLR